MNFNALQINDYTPYLRIFIEQQMVNLRKRNKLHLLERYQELYSQL